MSVFLCSCFIALCCSTLLPLSLPERYGARQRPVSARETLAAPLAVWVVVARGTGWAGPLVAMMAAAAWGGVVRSVVGVHVGPLASAGRKAATAAGRQQQFGDAALHREALKQVDGMAARLRSSSPELTLPGAVLVRSMVAVRTTFLTLPACVSV